MQANRHANLLSTNAVLIDANNLADFAKVVKFCESLPIPINYVNTFRKFAASSSDQNRQKCRASPFGALPHHITPGAAPSTTHSNSIAIRRAHIIT